MPRPIARAAVLSLAMLFAGQSARAAVLAFEAEFRLETANLAPLVFETTGVATVNGSGGGLHVQSLALADGAVSGGPLLIPLTDPAVAPISAVRFEMANEAGSVVESGGVLGGVIPLGGDLRYCLFGSSNACTDPIANLVVPLDPVGVGGFAVAEGPALATIFGAPWTTATAAVGTITRMGGRAGPASGTSTTAQIGGSIQLVTPILIFGGFESTPAFATLTLRFVPEPATFALVAGGIAALCAAGARRRRRSAREARLL
jgi:hypothetical protein